MRCPFGLFPYQGNTKNERTAMIAKIRFISTIPKLFLNKAKIIVTRAVKTASGIVMKNAPKKKRISMYTSAVKTPVNILRGLSSFVKFIVLSLIYDFIPIIAQNNRKENIKIYVLKFVRF